jgi:hypothetical protein
MHRLHVRREIGLVAGADAGRLDLQAKFGAGRAQLLDVASASAMAFMTSAAGAESSEPAADWRR